MCVHLHVYMLQSRRAYLKASWNFIFWEVYNWRNNFFGVNFIDGSWIDTLELEYIALRNDLYRHNFELDIIPGGEGTQLVCIGSI